MRHELPLLHRRILITREDASAKLMAERVTSLGGDPVITPVLSFKKVASDKRQIFEAIEADWVVFTSGNGVRFFLESVDEHKLDKKRLPNLAVVGEKTQKVLQKKGLEATLVPDTFSAKGLASAFETLPMGQKITLVKGRLAKETLEKDLIKQGHHVTSLTVYDTVPNFLTQLKLQQVLKEGALDVLTFTSPSGLHFFLELSGLRPQDAFFDQLKVACIGPETRRAATQLGLKNIIMPDHYTADALVEAIAYSFANYP
jgi:uroporphyrinogen-III synthase